LILSLGLDSWGAALSIAANIAGAVSLSIDNNPDHLREIVRTGSADFVVTTLDEAIRAMKNEVRKRAPLSVGLHADPLGTLEESVARGLAPQLFSTFLSEDLRIMQSAHQFQTLGARLMHFRDDIPPPTGFLSSQSLIAPILQEKGWQLHTFTLAAPSVLRQFDARALALLPEEDTFRRCWLISAPRLLQRQRPPERSLWLTEEEAQALA
jgi:urocanate hydratase